MSKDLFERRAAGISDDGVYRYWLQRTWDDSLPQVVWIMLNPSTADADNDDPTIRRCLAFARRWGAGGIIVINLFALRATDPAELKKHPDPIGPDNNFWLETMRDSVNTRLVAAWGAGGALLGRDRIVTACLIRGGRAVECCGLTKGGHPRHPLYVKGDAEPMPYPPVGEGK